MTKKRHHYIPQFYLNGFVDHNNEPYIWVYDKKGNNIIKSTAKDIAVTEHYFSFKDISGIKDSDSIENFIAELEGIAASILKKIFNNNTLNDNEKMDFAYFVALMMVRVPNFRENIETAFAETAKIFMQFSASHKGNFEAMVKRYQEQTGNDLGMPIEEARQVYLNLDKHYKLKTNPQISLAMSLNHIKDYARLFFNMKWLFLRATTEYKFLSGDNPLYYFDPTHNPRSFYGVGLCNKNIEVTLPLSQDLCALGTWHGKEGYLQATNQLVKIANQKTVIASLRFVFSSEKSETINNFVKKYQDSAPKIRVG